MNIIGLDGVIFGVDNLAECEQFLTDYGLIPQGDGKFAAQDNTFVQVVDKNDPSLPPALETGNTHRKTIYAVPDQATLDEIEAELSKDREVNKLADGSLEAQDDMGITMGFQITIRKEIDVQGEIANVPGAKVTRPVNDTAVGLEHAPLPVTFSHIVYFVPDHEKAEAFYRDRLGFITTDRFTGVGPFMRPAGMIDHHTLFMIETPPHMKGVEHFTFHMSGPTDVMWGGNNLENKGYQSFWGPGRHILGSNWFWYFRSPMGCNMEYDADMDMHDDEWEAREMPMSADNSQSFLLQYREKWSPGGPPG